MGENKNSGLITGLIIGAAIGAGLAFLFGTKKGQEVRKKVRDQYPELFDQIETTLGDIRENLDDEKALPQPKRFIKSGRKL